jgi:polysaccharide deacetylase family protein (PEP-CTERM system associated)
VSTPGTPITNVMTIDVEDYFHVSALAGAIRPEDWHRWEYRAEANTQRLLALFAEHDVKSTFFVLGWVAEKSPSLIREIHRQGHEVACHGFSHQLIYKQTPQLFTEETRCAKGLLEDLIGSEVKGYRAASWSITRQSLWALDVLVELGFKYDSSIFPIRHDVYGIPNAPVAPARITTPKGRLLVEFPASIASFFGARLPVAGGGYFRLLPYWLTLHGLRQINETARRPFAFYLHPWEIDPAQPRVEVGLKSRFRHYTNLERCEARLRDVLGRFRFSTMANVLTNMGLLGAAADREAA